MTIAAISRKLLKARKSLKMKQEVLGPLVGCSRSYISKIENGTSLPSVIIAQRFETALKMKKGELVQIIRMIKEKETALKKRAVAEARGYWAKDGYKKDGFKDGFDHKVARNGMDHKWVAKDGFNPKHVAK